MASSGINLTGDWKRADAVLAAAPEDLDRAIEMASRALAEYYVGKIKKKMASNVPPENSPFTRLMKSSSKTLIDHGDLRNAVTAVPTGEKGGWFIGIPRTVRYTKKPSSRGALGRFTATTKSASTMKTEADLADILENGRTIVQRLSRKQLKFLHATLGQHVSKATKGASSGVLVIHIPARPFVQPVFDEELEGARKRFTRYLLRNLKTLGQV